MNRSSTPRYCRCGTRLGQHHSGSMCSPCEKRLAALRVKAPDMPTDFWETEQLRDAFTAQHIGQVSRAYRKHPHHVAMYGKDGIPQTVLGGWLGLTQAQISRIENGSPVRHLDNLAHWATTLRIPEHLLWFKLPGERAERRPALAAVQPDKPEEHESVQQAPGEVLLPVVINGHPVLVPLDAATVAANGLGMHLDELTVPVTPGSPVVPAVGWKTMRDAMERRRLLQWAATVLGAGALGFSAESVRQLLDLVLTGEQRSAEDWEVTCADHLHAIRTRPPAQVRDDLVVDLLAVQRQLEMTPSGRDATELRRITAMLAMINANAFTRLGEHGPAIRWWRTARDAADASTDLDLCLIVRAAEAGFGLYGQRDPQTVLTLIDHAQRIAGPRPSVGLAMITSTQAKALSLLGRHDEAIRALNTLINVSEADLRGQGPSFWTPGQVHFAESWVYAGSGNEAATERARDDLVKLACPSALDYQYQVNIQLHQALCTVVKGGVEQGVQHAVTVLQALPSAYQSNMITETGRIVLRAVPLERRERPAVAELREVLAITATPAG